MALVEEYGPDLLIAEVDPGDDEQIDVLRRAGQSRPGLKSVVVAETSDVEAIQATFAAGASVYCVKTAEQADLASAIRQAFEQSIYMAKNGGDLMTASEETAAETAVHDLTRREVEILQLVAEGHSNSQLARMLWVTEQTVKFHLSNIYRKLDVSNRTEASRWAQLNGLLPTTEGDSGSTTPAAA
jgi:DNA-binding NarL/FixJ family response regulator